VPEVGFALGEKLRPVAVAEGVEGRAQPDRRGWWAAYDHPPDPARGFARRAKSTIRRWCRRWDSHSARSCG
jgi:hypothetical protein